MGRRGPEPDYAKREAFARLISEGVPSLRACRMVGINRQTGKRWRNGRRIRSGGRVLHLPPVITPIALAVRRYSPRYLSEDERIRLADLRREGRSMREIAALMGRSPSTISRELARGAELRGRVAGRLQARWSPEQISRRLRQEFPDQPERWLCAETIYQAVYRPDLGGPAP